MNRQMIICTLRDKERVAGVPIVSVSPVRLIVSALCAGLVGLTLSVAPACAGAVKPPEREGPMNGGGANSWGAGIQKPSAAKGSNPVARPAFADFGQARASRDARQTADWVVASADNHDLPFVIVDKVDAKVFVFDATGRILGASSALLGAARGDNSVPGIGDRALADQPPETRITPAGRFLAALGVNAHHHDVVWVDYHAAVALHRVVTTNPQEHRLERLATSTPLDNRISWGCINVPVRFYETVVRPAFIGTRGFVYVLPEARPALAFFGAYDAEERMRSGYAHGTKTAN